MQPLEAQGSAIHIMLVTSRQIISVLNRLYDLHQKVVSKNRSKRQIWWPRVYPICNKFSSSESKKISYRLTQLQVKIPPSCQVEEPIVKWAGLIMLMAWARQKASCKWVVRRSRPYRCSIVSKNHIRAKAVLRLLSSTPCHDIPWPRHTLFKVAPSHNPPLLVAGKTQLLISSLSLKLLKIKAKNARMVIATLPSETWMESGLMSKRPMSNKHTYVHLNWCEQVR